MASIFRVEEIISARKQVATQQTTRRHILYDDDLQIYHLFLGYLTPGVGIAQSVQRQAGRPGFDSQQSKIFSSLQRPD
jgi:hypothetical protein